MSVSIDPIVFRRRVVLLQEALSSQNASAWITILGKGDAGTQEIATHLHMWLLGYPFANTTILVTKDRTVLIAAVKQVKFLEGLKSPRISVVTRPKDIAESKEVLEKELAELGIDASSKVLEFSKDKVEGELAGEWSKIVAEKFPNTEDGAKEFDNLRRSKDENELRAIRTASKAAAGIMSKYFSEEMTQIVDEDKKISYQQMSRNVTETIDNVKLLRQLRLGSEFDASRLDWSQQPKVGDNSSSKQLGVGVTSCELRMNYKHYNAVIARSYLIDAPKQAQSLYSTLLSVERKALSSIKDGVKCSDVYAAALAVAKDRDSSIVEKGLFPKVIGYGVGIESRDSVLELRADNDTIIKDGMVLVISLDIDGLRLSDTARVTSADQPIVFTDAPKAREDVIFEINGGDADASLSSSKVKSEKLDDLPPPRSERAPRAARADLKREATENADLAVQKHQQELKDRLQEYGMQKYKASEDNNEEDKAPVFNKFEAYKRETQLPALETLRIAVDQRAQAIVLPIAGRPVPFHINTFKNGSANDEGDYVYLRLNFNSPDSLTLKRDEVPYDNPNAHFIKSLTLRSRDGQRMRETLKKIQDMKREVGRRENEKKQMADIVQQDKLIEVRDRRPQRLEPIYVRPLPEGKRIPGALEIHKNGLRFSTAIKEQQVDVLYSNLEHLFYQPCDHELIVLIHCHLKNPIMIGKHKTKDVQFYRDATDMSFDETGGRKRRYIYGDEDELEQEREERRRRLQLNKEFMAFSELIARSTNGKVEVDVPFRELGFNGVPYRSSMFLQPTTQCLVQLSETPFLVVTLSEIEVAVLERVRFGLREFDMVLIYHDYKRPPIQINSIPVTQLDSVKSWLNEVDIPFYDVQLNLKWKEIMNTIASAPYSFFAENGGWSFLDPEEDEAGNGADESSEEGESEFDASDVSEEEDDEDDFSSAEDESESASAPSDDEEEDGEDWSDLEREAAEDDKRKNRD